MLPLAHRAFAQTTVGLPDLGWWPLQAVLMLVSILPGWPAGATKELRENRGARGKWSAVEGVLSRVCDNGEIMEKPKGKGIPGVREIPFNFVAVPAGFEPAFSP